MKEIFNNYDEKALREDANNLIKLVNNSYPILRDEYGLTFNEVLGVLDSQDRTKTLMKYFKENSSNKFGTAKEYREKAQKAEDQMFCESRMFEYDPMSNQWICEKRSLVRPVNFIMSFMGFNGLTKTIEFRDYIEYDPKQDQFVYNWDKLSNDVKKICIHKTANKRQERAVELLQEIGKLSDEYDLLTPDEDYYKKLRFRVTYAGLINRSGINPDIIGGIE